MPPRGLPAGPAQLGSGSPGASPGGWRDRPPRCPSRRAGCRRGTPRDVTQPAVFPPPKHTRTHPRVPGPARAGSGASAGTACAPGAEWAVPKPTGARPDPRAGGRLGDAGLRAPRSLRVPARAAGNRPRARPRAAPEFRARRAEVLTHAVFLLALGGHPARHAAARAPAPRPPPLRQETCA